MKKALTAVALNSLKPRPIPYYVSDLKQEGLRVRVAPDGKLTWNVTVRIKHGKVKSTSLGRCDTEGRSGLDLAGARNRAAAIIKAARMGQDFVAQERHERQAKENAKQVSTLIQDYYRDISSAARKGGALRTAEDIRRRLERALSTKLADFPRDLTRKSFAIILDSVAEEFPREAEKRRQVIDAMFKWALAKGYIDENPISGLPSYGVGAPRDRVLSEEELRILWKWLEDGAGHMPLDVVDVLRLQLLTGARVGEIAGIDANEISEEQECLVWVLPAARSKNKKSHTRPLVGKARDIIKNRLESFADGKLFRTANGERALRSDDVGLALNHRERPIPHFTTHDLRRTFVSGLDELGVPLETIAATIGHQRGGKDTRTLVKHYSRPNLDSRIEAAMTAWDNHLDKIFKE